MTDTATEILIVSGLAVAAGAAWYVYHAGQQSSAAVPPLGLSAPSVAAPTAPTLAPVPLDGGSTYVIGGQSNGINSAGSGSCGCSAGGATSMAFASTSDLINWLQASYPGGVAALETSLQNWN